MGIWGMMCMSGIMSTVDRILLCLYGIFAFAFNHAWVERADDTGCLLGLQISLFSAKLKRKLIGVVAVFHDARLRNWKHSLEHVLVI
jgi:hypothetical protein